MGGQPERDFHGRHATGSGPFLTARQASSRAVARLFPPPRPAGGASATRRLQWGCWTAVSRSSPEPRAGWAATTRCVSPRKARASSRSTRARRSRRRLRASRSGRSRGDRPGSSRRPAAGPSPGSSTCVTPKGSPPPSPTAREELDADGGAADIVVANAGISRSQGGMLDTAPEVFRETIDINLTGVFLTMQAGAKAMVQPQARRLDHPDQLDHGAAQLRRGPGLHRSQARGRRPDAHRRAGVRPRRGAGQRRSTPATSTPT